MLKKLKRLSHLHFYIDPLVRYGISGAGLALIFSLVYESVLHVSGARPQLANALAFLFYAEYFLGLVAGPTARHVVAYATSANIGCNALVKLLVKPALDIRLKLTRT
eukprot:gene12729-12825_t